MSQTGLYEEYCIDTNSILDFWRVDSDKVGPYHVKVKSFRALWDYLTAEIEKGRILVLQCVAKEITPEDEELQGWLSSHNELFIDDECSLELKGIVSVYDIYTKTRGSLADAILIATAKHRGLTVITSELHVPNNGKFNPKIPNVCEEYSVNWLNLPDFFAKEGL